MQNRFFYYLFFLHLSSNFFVTFLHLSQKSCKFALPQVYTEPAHELVTLPSGLKNEPLAFKFNSK